MRNSIGASVVALAICATPGAQAADVAAGIEAATPPAGYPAPDCIKPDAKLIKPEGNYSSGTWTPDNFRIRKYNQQAKAFDDCMHAYIDTANSAVKRIQDKANGDIKQITDSANGAMKDVEGKIRQAVGEANEVKSEEADAVAGNAR